MLLKDEERVPLSRRCVVAGLCASAFLAACSSTSEPPPQPDSAKQRESARARELATGEMERWAAIVGTVFEASGYRLKLEGVRPLASAGERPAQVSRQQAFVAIFVVLAGEMPGELIYTLTAPGVGPLDVFLAVADTPELPNRMHAVFN